MAFYDFLGYQIGIFLITSSSFQDMGFYLFHSHLKDPNKDVYNFSRIHKFQGLSSYSLIGK